MLKSEIAIVTGLSYEGRTVLSGRWGTKRAWGNLAWADQTDETIFTLPDGRSVRDVLASGGLDTLPECWIGISNTGKLDDMIWSGAMMYSFVSDRFLQALETAGIGGYQTLPLETQPKRGARFSGYSLLLPDGGDPDADIRSYPYVYRPTAALDVSARVLQALTDAGAADLATKDAAESVAAMLAA
mgnify:CR=1 FL=1